MVFSLPYLYADIILLLFIRNLHKVSLVKHCAKLTLS
jgi:hypothetical protein